MPTSGLKRCGWRSSGKYSRFYRCGYAAGSGGSGTLNGGDPFDTCGYTRSDCEARGMFVNFGGIEFVPPAIGVRTYGDKSSHTSAISVNEARYNDFVPMIYGTAWFNPPVVFARNDGNLTRMEVLLGLGEMQGVLKLLVNDVEIPAGYRRDQYDGNRLVQHSDAGDSLRCVQSGLHGRHRTSGGRPVRQHGLPFGGGPEPDQQWRNTAQGRGAGTGTEAPGLCGGRNVDRRAVLEQSCVGSARRPAPRWMEPCGDRHREFRCGGRLLR